jgi:hypothetical protein
MKKVIAVLSIMILTTGFLFAQKNNNSWWKNNTSLTGYIKYINTTSFRDLSHLTLDNQLHNRINFKIYINEDFTFDLQIRNRLLWGNSLINPNFKKFIDTKTDINLSGFLIDETGLLLHSKIDRLSLTYNTADWEFKVGRQRINWGKTWAWNPNDLFNAYNILDFDYEERPGNDALSIRYNYGETGAFQAVYSYADDFDNSIIALRDLFSIKTYDMQVLVAKYRKYLAAGIGWEGYIKSAGFKGETTLFTPYENNSNQSTSILTSLSLDYFFKNGIMLIAEILYNSSGITESEDFNIQSFYSESLNARNLMPNRLSYYLQSSYQINPASSTNLGLMYLQELNALGILPSYSYNISENWDMDFFAQLFFGKTDNDFKNIQNGIYFRLRWSY